MKICFICAPGGHLIELLSLKEAFDFPGINIFMITYKEKMALPLMGTNISKVYYLKNMLVGRIHKQKIIKYIVLLFHMLQVTLNEARILYKEKPDIIISTGSEIAIPAFFIAKLCRIKTIYIESLTRVNDLSGTGKIVYFFSDIFFVQWAKLICKYRKAKCLGNILPSIEMQRIQHHYNDYIFVTVGTAPFPRLVENIDNIAQRMNDRVIVQIGRTSYEPKHCKYIDFTKDYEEFQDMIKNAKVVISHAGVGSILSILEQGTPLIVVPRMNKYQEHNDDHQLELARELKREGIVKVAYDVEDIPGLIDEIENDTKSNSERSNDMLCGKAKLIQYLKCMIASYMQ